MNLRKIFILVLISIPCLIFAQNRSNQLSIAAGSELKSFSIPQNIEYFPKVKYQPGIFVGLTRYLNPSFNVFGKAGIAVVKHPAGFSNQNKSISMFEFLATFQYKLNNNYILKENFFLQPFVSMGFGVNKIQSNNLAQFLPFGIGANIPITKDWNAQISSTYHFATKRTELNYYNISLGSVWLIGKQKLAPIIKPGISPENMRDTDKDGVADISDNCPNDFGNPNTYGCPDSDNDGIIDRYDECPYVQGYLNYNGCVDTDGDQISDNKDKCPETFGLKELEGCAPPDTDNDGIPDSRDKCPKDKGSIIKSGCPL